MPYPSTTLYPQSSGLYPGIPGGGPPTPTPVDGTVLDLKWDIRNSVDAPVRTLKWDVRVFLYAFGLSLVWDVRRAVPPPPDSVQLNPVGDRGTK